MATYVSNETDFQMYPLLGQFVNILVSGQEIDNKLQENQGICAIYFKRVLKLYREQFTGRNTGCL